MSATLRVADFMENDRLFREGDKPRMITVAGRQHEVTAHFVKTTEPDY